MRERSERPLGYGRRVVQEKELYVGFMRPTCCETELQASDAPGAPWEVEGAFRRRHVSEAVQPREVLPHKQSYKIMSADDTSNQSNATATLSKTERRRAARQAKKLKVRNAKAGCALQGRPFLAFVLKGISTHLSETRGR